MTQFLIQNAASFRIDEIYCYTLEQWGTAKAESYISGLFEAFEKIETHEVFSRPIPAEFGVDGFFFRYEKHFGVWGTLVLLLLYPTGFTPVKWSCEHEEERQ